MSNNVNDVLPPACVTLASGKPAGYAPAMSTKEATPRNGYGHVFVRMTDKSRAALDAVIAKRQEQAGPLGAEMTITRWMMEHIQADAAQLGIVIADLPVADPAPRRLRGATAEEAARRVAPGEFKEMGERPVKRSPNSKKSRAGRSAPRAAARRKVTAH